MNRDQLWDDLARDIGRELHDYRSRLQRLAISVKSDKTLLTEADLAVQNLIIDRIREIDPNPVIVAEEDERTTVRKEVLDRPERIWVVDPIDGTAEFVKPQGREFCSVVCLLEDLMPTAAFILAPELGTGSTPVVITADARDGTIAIKAKLTSLLTENSTSRDDGIQYVSVTRSKDTPPEDFESELAEMGYGVKTRTTSQTLDMVRTAAANISGCTDLELPPFRLFMRKSQKVWDGLAGLCLGQAAGLTSVDAEGNNRLPVAIEILSQPEPIFPSTIMGDRELVSWLLKKL